MSGKNKNYNSIIFLTTLSVYLGLVLVSGSPQVFAYAATNKLFDIQQEIEFKDDLDNKPDDSCSDLKAKIIEQDNQFIREYLERTSLFLKDYSPNLKGEMLNGIGSNDFSTLRDEFSITFFQLKANKNKFSGKINLKINFEVKEIIPFVLGFNESLKFERCKSKNKTEKVIAENTKVTFENNQIFIITNLPRASIDSLLK